MSGIRGVAHRKILRTITDQSSNIAINRSSAFIRSLAKTHRLKRLKMLLMSRPKPRNRLGIGTIRTTKSTCNCTVSSTIICQVPPIMYRELHTNQQKTLSANAAAASKRSWPVSISTFYAYDSSPPTGFHSFLLPSSQTPNMP